MATQAASVERESGYNKTVTWTTMANGDDGAPVTNETGTHATVQFLGTFGTGGTIILEGSNDGVTWYNLTSNNAAAITTTSAALFNVYEVCKYLRPRVTAGTGTSLTAVLVLRA